MRAVALVVVALLALAGCAGHNLLVEVDETHRCNVYRDGQRVGGRWSPGPVVDFPHALR